MDHLTLGEPLWTQVFGSGWETFPWWSQVTFIEGDWDTEGVAVVVHTPPDDPDEPSTTHRLTPANIRAAYLVAKDHYSGGTFRLFEDDIDAIAGDAILQLACFGTLVYS